MDKLKVIDEKALALKNKILNSGNMIPEKNFDVFYVSSDGNDSDNGKSPATSWKTLSRVSAALNKENTEPTCICFKRGDTFRGQLVAGSNVIYTAYGEGKKPLLCGSPEDGACPEKWKPVCGFKGVWVYEKELCDVGSVFFNGGESYAVKRCPAIVNGEYEFGVEALENGQFLSLIPADVAAGLNQKTAPNLKGKVFLRCDEGNPGEIYSSIEFAERLYNVTLPDRTKNVLIDNLAIMFGGAHGIGGGYVDNLTVQNCEIGYIGGGIMSYGRADDNGCREACRYGNGVELHTYCNGYTVENCWVHDIYDAGITHQQGGNHSVGLMFKDVSYIGNLIENCIYSVEYFAKKSDRNGATVLMENIRIADNIMRNAGYGFGAQRTLQRNGWNMANHINGWNRAFNMTNGKFKVENNIFDCVLRSQPDRPIKCPTSLILAAAGDEGWLPEFSKNTYIVEKGNQLAYLGTVLPAAVRVTPYVYADENATAEKVFGDKNGEIILL